MEILLVVSELAAIVERYRTAARFGENQFARRSIPLVSGTRAHVIIDDALGQHTKLVGAALLDYLDIGIAAAYLLYEFRSLGRLMRTRDRHARMRVRSAAERQRLPCGDDIVVRISGIRRRGHIGHEMRTVPALTFRMDRSMEYGSKMDELFKKINKD